MQGHVVKMCLGAHHDGFAAQEVSDIYQNSTSLLAGGTGPMADTLRPICSLYICERLLHVMSYAELVNRLAAALLLSPPEPEPLIPLASSASEPVPGASSPFWAGHASPHSQGPHYPPGQSSSRQSTPHHPSGHLPAHFPPTTPSPFEHGPWDPNPLFGDINDSHQTASDGHAWEQTELDPAEMLDLRQRGIMLSGDFSQVEQSRAASAPLGKSIHNSLNTLLESDAPLLLGSGDQRVPNHGGRPNPLVSSADMSVDGGSAHWRTMDASRSHSPISLPHITDDDHMAQGEHMPNNGGRQHLGTDDMDQGDPWEAAQRMGSGAATGQGSQPDWQNGAGAEPSNHRSSSTRRQHSKGDIAMDAPFLHVSGARPGGLPAEAGGKGEAPQQWVPDPMGPDGSHPLPSGWDPPPPRGSPPMVDAWLLDRRSNSETASDLAALRDHHSQQQHEQLQMDDPSSQPHWDPPCAV